MSGGKSNWGNRLYRGEVSYDFIGKQKRWYAVSGALLAVSVAALLIFEMKFSLDFRGGSQFTIPTKSSSATQQQVKDSAGALVKDPIVQTQSSQISGRSIIVKTTPLDQETQGKIRDALAKTAGVASDQIRVDSVSGSWGKEITDKAVTGLIVFVALVMLYLAIFYEWKM